MDVVEGMHRAIGAVPALTPLVYRTIRGVTGFVGTSIDTLVALAAPPERPFRRASGRS